MLCDGLDITNERTMQHAVYCISPLRRSKILCPHLNMLDDFQGKDEVQVIRVNCTAVPRPCQGSFGSGQGNPESSGCLETFKSQIANKAPY